MATHQEIAGESDEELLRRMVNTHPNRFGEGYWATFDEQVRPRLGESPVIADLGCGPGLLLRDLSSSVPAAKLYGSDLTPLMIEHARSLEYEGGAPTLEVRDIVNEPLPFDDGSVDVATMAAVLHLFEDPFAFLAEVRRVLKPTGALVLLEWVRTPLANYLARRTSDPAVSDEEFHRRSLRLFPSHNKYTVDDWQWLLEESGYEVAAVVKLRMEFNRLFVAFPKAVT